MSITHDGPTLLPEQRAENGTHDDGGHAARRRWTTST